MPRPGGRALGHTSRGEPSGQGPAQGGCDGQGLLGPSRACAAETAPWLCPPAQGQGTQRWASPWLPGWSAVLGDRNLGCCSTDKQAVRAFAPLTSGLGAGLPSWAEARCAGQPQWSLSASAAGSPREHDRSPPAEPLQLGWPRKGRVQAGHPAMKPDPAPPHSHFSGEEHRLFSGCTAPTAAETQRAASSEHTTSRSSVPLQVLPRELRPSSTVTHASHVKAAPSLTARPWRQAA